MSTEWEAISDTEREVWWEKAIDYLLRMAWMPLTDDVWATDKYSEQIDAKAKDLWESSLI